MAEQLLTVARRFLEADESGEWDVLREVTGDEIFIGRVEWRPGSVVDALGDGDWGTLAPVLAEHFAPSGDWVGVDELIEIGRHWKSHHSHRELSIERLSVIDDDRVAYLLESTEVHDGMYYGYEPTGNEITLEKLGVLRIEDGEVRQLWSSWSFDEFLEQMGISPGSGTVAKIEYQFYRVVNRVLRHDLRTDINAIAGYADLIADANGDVEAHVERLLGTNDALLATVETVRELEQRLLNDPGSQVIELDAVVRSVVDELRDEFPQAEIGLSTPGEPLTVTSNRSLVEIAVREAVENALAHNEASPPVAEVSVQSVERTDDAAELTLADGTTYEAAVSIADNGPGIPDHEITPLREERETPLVHGSGLGLWAIKWGIERLGGEVEFGENTPGGSVVTLNIPNQPLDEVG